MKKIIISIIGIVAIIGLFSLFVDKNNNNGNNNNDTSATSSAKVILFYGDGCPHCKIVEDYLTANPEAAKKVQFEKKEVFNNKNNSNLMLEKARACNVPTDQGMGVPFLWDGTAGDKCLVGDVDIVNYFKDKAAASN
jgi:glutaredoxin